MMPNRSLKLLVITLCFKAAGFVIAHLLLLTTSVTSCSFCVDTFPVRSPVTCRQKGGLCPQTFTGNSYASSFVCLLSLCQEMIWSLSSQAPLYDSSPLIPDPCVQSSKRFDLVNSSSKFPHFFFMARSSNTQKQKQNIKKKKTRRRLSVPPLLMELGHFVGLRCGLDLRMIFLKTHSCVLSPVFLTLPQQQFMQIFRIIFPSSSSALSLL